MQELIAVIVNGVEHLGYFGIFILTTLESTFLPFPSEVVLIPAGYLVSQNEMNFLLVIFSGTIGSVSGAWINYLLAEKFGRTLMVKLIKESRLQKIESFFNKHGAISTFNGRLIPGVRQYISFPAGLSKMNPRTFTIFTALGSSIWITVLTLLGYFLGEKRELLQSYLHEITIVVIVSVTVITLCYVFIGAMTKRREANEC